MDYPKFQYPLVIREAHLDTFGHVNNATYLQILEEARWELITSRGYGVDKIRESGLGPTILEWQMRFRKELRLREKIVIETQGLAYNKKIGTLKQTILNEKGELCFEATMTFALFDVHARKLVEATPDWLKAIGMETN
ncbi:MAG: acyl-CoA thioesterase [Bdellovibrionales bacterium]|nr:acyl-CoA thioesterase [Bdellovibrionales bacterium]